MRANDAFSQPSNRVNRFSQVPRADIPRSIFNLNHSHKGTIEDAGRLRPFDLYEVYPGDTFKIKPTIFMRLITQLAPIMDNMYLDTFYFFVPNRLVWTNWEKFMGERTPDPDSSIDFTIPQITSPGTGWTSVSLASAFGLPVLVAATMSVNALPFRAYNLIWNEWFRDQNIQDGVVVDTDDGPDSNADYTSQLRRGKRHDYFTSCLPFPQKGDAVDLPLGDTAPVVSTGTNIQLSDSGVTDANLSYSTATSRLLTTPDLTNAALTFFGSDTGLETDLSTATAATINQLREAFQVQRLLERDARGGTRYTEMIHSHFGVVSPDGRLQRPEFLGGDSVPFSQQTVAQTTFQATETRFDGKGVLAANSAFVSRGGSITKSFTEHGYIIGLMCVRADISYQQGIDKHFLRSTRYDYYFPAFAHLGEQVVESREIYYDGTGSAVADPPTGDYEVFGYQERFAELRYMRSMITGSLNSNATSPLDVFHLAQDFASRPTLSTAFISDDAPIERITNVTPSATSPAFWFDAFIECRAVRPMPTYSVPGLIDHF